MLRPAGGGFDSELACGTMEGGKKKGYSSRLSGMKFMQRGRDRAKSRGDSVKTKGKANKETRSEEQKGCSIIYEADPLPRGRTTGRLSFGKKKKNVAGESDGGARGKESAPAAPPPNPAYEPIAAEDGADAERKRKGGPFPKPKHGELKKFKTSEKE